MIRSRVVVVVCVLLAAIAPAYAEDKASAEQLFRIGADAYRAGNFDAAASNFDRAYELFAAPEIAFSAAQAHRLQYQADRNPTHVKRAVELFEAYIANAPGGGKRKDALAHLERLRDVLAKLEASGAKVAAVVPQTPAVYVSVPIVNALITVDGKAVERYTSIEVEPGEHVVAVSADGYFPEQRRIPVAKGQVIVPIELKPRPAMLAITSEPGARVVVDGRPASRSEAKRLGVGTLPASPVGRGATPGVASPRNTTRSTLEVAPGKRFVTVYARGRELATRELELAPGQELTLDVPLHATTRRRAVPYVAAGAGVLLVGTLAAATVAVAADFAAADLRDSSGALDAADSARYEQLRERRGSFRTVGFLAGAATLAGAGVALWMYYADTPSSDDLGRPVERANGGFAPIILGGLGLGYAGGF